MINFKPSFNDKSLKNVPIVKCAEGILKSVADQVILQADLVDIVSTITGKTKESVRGTLWGGDITPPNHKLMGTQCFKVEWFAALNHDGKKIIVRQNSNTGYKRLNTEAYNDPNKQLAREHGAEKFLKLSRVKHPKILTMASEHGFDVIRFKKVKPNCIVHNVEYNENVLNKVLRLNLPMNSYLGDISDCVATYPERYFDIINYDTDGYVCQRLDNALNIINDRKATKILCLTIQNLKNFRNHGAFAEQCRRKYGGYENPTMAYLEHGALSNYEIIDTFAYSRTNNPNSKGMIVINFKVKC